MQSLSLFALLLEIAPVIAGFSPLMHSEERSWTPARETGSPAAGGGDGDGGLAPAPAPTEAARHPDFGEMELVKRYDMGKDTCGFASGYKSEAWTCFKVGAFCATTGRYIGCCAGSTPACYSTIFSTCIAYKSPSSSLSSTTTSKCGTGSLCCGSSSPECFTWRFSTSAKPGSTYSAFNCYARGKGGTGTLLDAPPALTLTSGTLSSTSDLNPSTTDSSPPTSALADGGSSSSTPVGAIVGGVVGGLAVIGIAIVAILWLVYRQKRTHDPPPPSMVGTSSVGGSATPQPPQPSPAPTAGTYYAFNQHPDNQHHSTYGSGAYGYYAGAEQKAPGQMGFDPHGNHAPQMQFAATGDGTHWPGYQPQPQHPPQGQQQYVSELPTNAPQRHELG